MCVEVNEALRTLVSNKGTYSGVLQPDLLPYTV